MITIEQLKTLNKLESIAITEHVRIRLYERYISIDDIINGIRAKSLNNMKTINHYQVV